MGDNGPLKICTVVPNSIIEFIVLKLPSNTAQEWTENLPVPLRQVLVLANFPNE